MEFPFHGWGGGGECLSYPPPPGISVIFQLGWVPSGKNICVKNVVARYYNAKDNFFLQYNKIFSFVLIQTSIHFSVIVSIKGFCCKLKYPANIIHHFMEIGQWDCDIALIFRSYKHKHNTSNSAHWNTLKLESIFLVNTCLTNFNWKECDGIFRQ